MVNTYAMSYVCLKCCKSFKRKLDKPVRKPETMVCPECGGPSYNFGRNFTAPKKTDKKQWQKITYLFEHGFRFQKIRTGSGHHDTVPYPDTLEAAKEFVIKYNDYSITTW